MRSFVLAMAVLLLVVACEEDDSEPRPIDMPSGIDVTVVAGPACPVVQAGSPCPDTPLAAPFRVTELIGRSSEVFESDDEGYLRVLLAPGKYEIQPLALEGQALLAPGEMQIVAVNPGGISQVILTYDTGIR